MCSFDIQVIPAPVYLQIELNRSWVEYRIKTFFFEKKGKIEFYGKYIYEDKFAFLKQLTMRITAAMGTVYLCESLFSNLKIVRSKNCNNLSDENMTKQLRCSVSKITINIKKCALALRSKFFVNKIRENANRH